MDVKDMKTIENLAASHLTVKFLENVRGQSSKKVPFMTFGPAAEKPFGYQLSVSPAAVKLVQQAYDLGNAVNAHSFFSSSPADALAVIDHVGAGSKMGFNISQVARSLARAAEDKRRASRQQASSPA